MPQVLDNIKSISTDVLRVEHRSSEPFDHPVAPADIANPLKTWLAGEVACISATGYISRADITDIATISVVGLFMTNRYPNDLKNDYVEASGNASIFSNGIVTLSTQITPATINAGDELFLSYDGKITNVPVTKELSTGNGDTLPVVNTAARIGKALSSRTVAGADVRVKLEL